MDERLIAIVDDEPELISTVSEYLEKKGYVVKGFSDAESFFAFLNKEKPDLIILDLMMPRINGFEVCKNLKKEEKFAAIPIIILSADSEEPDKVSSLDMGADDYIVKPFSLDELNARIKAVLRRKIPEGESTIINIGDFLTIDPQKYEVTVDGKKIGLTSTEFNILEYLSTREGKVFSRDRILHYLWGEEKIVVERTIDVHIRHLREKLGRAGNFIKNVRGFGYKFEVDAN